MNGLSKKFGLIGYPLGHSFSPFIHKELFNVMNLNASYELYELSENELEEFIQRLKNGSIGGINVTIPYKIKVMEYIDIFSREVEEIGAVNTLAFDNGKIKGYNTDYIGFGASLQNAGIKVQNKKATILGTGGASKAVSKYLIDNGIREITYVSRNPKINETMKQNVISYKELESIHGDILINCTPVGMFPHTNECPVEQSTIEKYTSIVDLIYNPEETVLLKEGRSLGKRCINGLYMLVAQAVAAEEVWNDFHVDKSILNEIVEKVRQK